MHFINANKHRIMILLPLLAVMIWSFNVVLNRYSIDYISPLSISFYRWLIPFVLLTPFMLKSVWQHKVSICIYWKKIAILSALGMVISQGLGYVASHYTTAIHMGMINAFVPLITLILAYLILKEPLKIYNVVGGLISILGLLLIISQGKLSNLFNLNISGYGDGLMLLAVMSYAFYCVLLKKWEIKLSFLLILYLQMAFAVLYHFPFVFNYGLNTIDQSNLPIILYAGVCTSLISSLLWMIAVNQLGAHQTSMFMNLMPIFTACIATLWLGEHWFYYHSIGAVIIIVGLCMSRNLKIFKFNRTSY